MRNRTLLTRGFSLVETLVVISIISVVSGIMLPVLVNSKKSAHKTDDLSKLRQLGQAGALYESQYGEFPLTTQQLVATNMVPSTLCYSNMDTTKTGIANELTTFNNPKMPFDLRLSQAPYKNSFVGLGEYGLTNKVMDEYVMTGPGAGWLVDATASEKTVWPTPTQWKGTYRRLTMEGSVITRKHQDAECFVDGEAKPCRLSVQLFVDPNPYLTELIKSDGQQPSQR
jgi:prepilin-type N-terminal cleavage/methylation domain-containing protein